MKLRTRRERTLSRLCRLIARDIRRTDVMLDAIERRNEERRALADRHPPTCESCGARADVRLGDSSTWCGACHGSALRQGYDTDTGTLIQSAN